jgi:cytochrome c-type biogenesis protein CcsB
MLITLAYVLLWLTALSSLIHARSGKSWTGWLSSSLLVLTLAVLSAGLVQRGIIAGHWPLTNAYEFGLVFLWSILAIDLLLEATWRQRPFGVFVLAIALVVASYAISRPEGAKVITPLLPALHSVYLQIHVTTSAIGYGAFGVAAGLGLARWILFREHGTDENDERHPSSAEVERMMERSLALGFPWLTLGILSGAIWAQNAWGRYWGWDPKETWALVTWLWYLLLFHLRALRRWRGRRLALSVVLGFGIVLFTFIGVPWLVRTVRLESLHGF